MKSGWQVKPLQSLCNDMKQDIVDGPFGSELQRKDYITEGVPVLKIQNIKPFAIELKKMDYVSPAKFQELKRHSYRHGDIVMTKLGSPLGVSAIVEDLDEGVIVADLVRIRAQRVNTKYLCYHLNSQRTNDFINSMQKGTTRPRVKLSVVRELPIAVPSPEEQKRIVAILDEAFAGIATAVANTEKNLANARELFDSYLNNVFTQSGEGWAEKRLQDVCEKITDGTHQTPKYFDDGVTFLSSRNVTSGTIDWENIKYIDTKQHLEMHRRVAPRVGDILLAKNGTTGVAAIVDRDVVFDIYVSLALLRSLGEVRPRYLLYFINSPVAKQQFNKRLKGIGVPNLHLQEIREVVLGFPSDLSQQDAIVKRSDLLNAEVCRLQTLYQHKLVTLAELKQSLLHKAFSGALTSQSVSALQEAVA